MNILKIIIQAFAVLYIFSLWYANAAINYTLTPLKYEIEVEPWEVVNRSAQIRNNGPETVTLGTATSDFQANWINGTPTFVRYSELVNPDQELSSWISIDQASITLAPWETKWITFSITVPVNATPWGHYAAVFFKNPNSESSSGAEIGINVDYWVLLLVNVEWEIVVDVEIEPIIISTGSSSSSSSGGGETSSSWWWGGGGGGGGWWGSSSSSEYVKDVCPFWDLTNSNFDGKCIDNFLNPTNSDEEVLEWNQWDINFTSGTWETDFWNNAVIPPLENFEISFNLPINNNGNSHVEPIWKIKLIDEDGKEIKNIGKKVKKNDYGAVIWEDIVDYLPLNDEWGKVLPSTKRNFDTSWKWFPYKEYNENGDQIINYWSPWEYYTNQNRADDDYMMPWERVCEKIKTKTIRADIEIAYKDANGDDVQYNSADEFEIEYKEQYIWLNPYVIIPFFFLIWLWLLFWLIIGKRKKICINKECEEKIKKSADICPYCETKQRKSRKAITSISTKKGNDEKGKKKKKEATKIRWKSDKEKVKKEKTKKKKK